MISWRDYLELLKRDGVSLVESEEEAITDGGDRAVVQTLCRHAGNRLLIYVIPGTIHSMDDAVPWIIKRQVPNVLRLDPEKYLFGEF